MTTITSTTTAVRRLGALCALALALVLATAATARAEFGLVPGSFEATVSNGVGSELEEGAGARPVSATTSFEFRTTAADRPDGNVKDVVVELPAGFVGDPQALPQCTGADFADLDPATGDPGCPKETQVGTMVNTIDLGFPLPVGGPVYNVMPPPGSPAAFGFTVLGVPVTVLASVRPGDRGLTMTIPNISMSSPVFKSTLTFWGVPADPRWDGERGGPSRAPLTPFLTNPFDCDSGPLRTTLRVNSWQQPDRYVVATADTPSAPKGCDRLDFRPSIEVTPDTPQAGAPAGYKVRLSVPENRNPGEPGTPHLRDAVVTLPAGTTVSPSAADGLGACTPGQIGLGSDADVTCPASSRIGEIAIDSPLMGEPLTGGIFLAKPTADRLLAIYLVAEGSGVTLKLPGTITPDPVTGQLTARFLDNPQLPFRSMELRFKGGQRAPLVNPVACGPATTRATLTPWSGGEPATASSSFQVTGACPARAPFAPGFVAGTSEPVAGASSPFTLRLTRADSEQELAQLQRVELPPGLVGKVGSVPLCDEARAAAGTCGAESRVGSITVGSGAGASPFHLGGEAYMTTGYRGAPFGLSLVVPALAGPFDLGTVVVRAGIFVNNDASLSVVADPLPTILKGIPLKLRSIALRFDRPGFMLNPTSCGPMSIRGTAVSTAGTSAQLASRFQVGDCAALRFAPKITATATPQANQAAGLHVRIAQPGQQANARSIAVTLPMALSARVATLGVTCSPEQSRTDTCPANTRVGTAEAVTPVLAKPLRGDVYYVRAGTRLPDLVVKLRGEVAIDLVGKVKIARGVITTTFGAIPDVPLSTFDMRLDGGERSALQWNRALCSAPMGMPTEATGQNGKRRARTVTVDVAGCRLAARASAQRGSSRVAVRVTAPGAGTLTLKGSRLATVRRSLARAGTVTVAVPLTSAGRRALARRGALKTAVEVRFAPREGSASSTSAKVTLRAAKPRR